MKEATTEPQEGRDPEAPEDDTGKMTFLEHLDEFRKRLVRIVTYVGIGFLASFYWHRPIYNFLARPITQYLPPGTKLAYTNPTDPFTLYMKVSILAGIFITAPFCLYEVWKFIAPGLYRKEKRYVVPFLVSSVFLFLAGGAFCYWYVLPQAYGFLINFGADFMPVIKIDEYLDLTNMMILGFGLIFEMPVIVAFLSLFGLVSAKFLWSKFKYAVVLIVALAALISPTGDAFNLLIWSAPMVVLYIISIGVAAIFGWRRKAQGLD
jgi:sec-independent protein translocase protein TatC